MRNSSGLSIGTTLGLADAGIDDSDTAKRRCWLLLRPQIALPATSKITAISATMKRWPRITGAGEIGASTGAVEGGEDIGLPYHRLLRSQCGEVSSPCGKFAEQVVALLLGERSVDAQDELAVELLLALLILLILRRW